MEYSIVCGGQNNSATANFSFVGGGRWCSNATDSNIASALAAAVVCGINNQASGAQSFIGAGNANAASAANAAVVAGQLMAH